MTCRNSVVGVGAAGLAEIEQARAPVGHWFTVRLARIALPSSSSARRLHPFPNERILTNATEPHLWSKTTRAFVKRSASSSTSRATRPWPRRTARRALRLLETMEPPCLILLDLMMPIMDGWTLGSPAGEGQPFRTSIPIVFLTAFAERDSAKQDSSCHP